MADDSSNTPSDGGGRSDVVPSAPSDASAADAGKMSGGTNGGPRADTTDVAAERASDNQEADGGRDTAAAQPEPAEQVALPEGGDQGLDDEDYASVVVIERDDEIGSICGSVDAAPTFAVVVYAPKGNRELATDLGVRRLRRHAEESGKVVAIATRSHGVASRARHVGIPVARRADRIRWEAGGRYVVGVFGRSVALPAVGRFVQLAAILVAAAVVVILALTMAPAASITAYPEGTPFSEVVTLTVSPNVSEPDYQKLLVPGEPVTATEHLTVGLPTTGTATVGSTLATATVTIQNPGVASMTVPQGTIVLAAPGFRPFALQGTVVVPAHESVNAAVIALDPGASGNVASGAITGWLDSQFRVLRLTNAEPAAGGTDTAEAAVAPSDIAAAQREVQALAAAKTVQARIVSARPHDAVLLDTASAKATAGTIAAAGTPADMLLVPVAVKITALAVREDVLAGLAEHLLNGKSGQYVAVNVSGMELAAAAHQGSDYVVTLRIQGDYTSNVTTANIRGAVEGKSKSAAESTLARQYGIQKSDIHLTPGWAPWLPRFGFRITVNVKTPVSATPTTKRG